MIVEDCLLLLLNLLKHNVSNQNFLKEGSYIQRLPSFLDVDQSDRPESDMWSAQKVTNVHLILEVRRSSSFCCESNPSWKFSLFFAQKLMCCFKMIIVCIVTVVVCDLTLHKISSLCHVFENFMATLPLYPSYSNMFLFLLSSV